MFNQNTVEHVILHLLVTPNFDKLRHALTSNSVLLLPTKLPSEIDPEFVARHILLSDPENDARLYSSSGFRVLIRRKALYLIGNHKEWTAEWDHRGFLWDQNPPNIKAISLSSNTPTRCFLECKDEHGKVEKTELKVFVIEEPLDAHDLNLLPGQSSEMPIKVPSKSNVFNMPTATASSLTMAGSMATNMMESLGTLSLFSRVGPSLPLTGMFEIDQFPETREFLSLMNTGRTQFIPDIQKTLSDLVMISVKSPKEFGDRVRKETARLSSLIHNPFGSSQKKSIQVGLELGLEVYFLGRLYPHIQSLLKSTIQNETETFEARMSALNVLALGDSTLSKSLCDTISATHQKHLYEIGSTLLLFSTSKVPAIMVESLINCHTIIADLASRQSESQSTDVILNMLIQSIIRTNPRNLIFQLSYLESFGPKILDGHVDYCLVNLKAAMLFIQALDLTDFGLHPTVLDSCGLPIVPTSHSPSRSSSASSNAPGTLLKAVKDLTLMGSKLSDLILSRPSIPIDPPHPIGPSNPIDFSHPVGSALAPVISIGIGSELTSIIPNGKDSPKEHSPTKKSFKEALREKSNKNV